jgi:hypothetical protein
MKPWQPGQTGNPDGRPVNDITRLREQYRHRLPELFEGLFRLANQQVNQSVSLAAHKELLDRLIGKPQRSCHHVAKDHRCWQRASADQR